MMNAPKRTVLFDLHQKLGARMTVFGGFEMPVSYSGIIEEHLAVRNSAGVFDLANRSKRSGKSSSGCGFARLVVRNSTNFAGGM